MSFDAARRVAPSSSLMSARRRPTGREAAPRLVAVRGGDLARAVAAGGRPLLRRVVRELAEVLVEREAAPRHLGARVLRYRLFGDGQLPRLERRVGFARATLDLAADLGLWRRQSPLLCFAFC